MKIIITLLLLVHLTAAGQAVYQAHDVEKVAEPASGVPYLNQFISANLQIPFKSSIKGLNGRVYLKGIVETDGSMTNIEVVRGIDTLCNREAVRVLSLYRAWKPATLKGEKVRQYVSFPITFKAAARTSYDSTQAAMVDYFDNKYRVTTDLKNAEYRVTQPVDDNGYIRHHVVYDQSRGGKWKQVGIAAFKNLDIWQRLDYPDAPADSVKAYQISARDMNMASHTSEYVFQTDGKLLSYTEYGLLTKATLQKSYDLRGMLRTLRIFSDSVTSEINWYDTGQIATATETTVPKPPQVEQRIYINAWNRAGEQVVKDGDGYWRSAERNYDGKWLFEEGRVISGAKNGKWIGKLADSTLHYEEQYELGVLDKGIAYHQEEKVEYEQAKINPMFKGGMTEFYKFLGTNIRFPIEAARRGVTGRVKLSFVVREDGSLSNYKIENRLGFGLEEEAIRVVKKMDGMWEPGVLRGKKVNVKYYVPINFQLE
ncbi:energy transducer TonB [Dyadobacter luticola]|uniref:TonB family protein n=1 Tax=Dyadobacter luticola TaxID=1979387 RepID=A0A5R9KNS1_9BACT|nr:energy transducer TonB [Dyadobacter luticola]TLU97925.1 TonB family protein [Dyadobacter luticola]